MRITSLTITGALALPLALTLAACSGGEEESAGEPVETAPLEQHAEPAPEPEPEEPITDPVSPELREDANAAAQGMSWHFKPRWALFGPPQSEGVLTLRCATGRGQLQIARAAGEDFPVGATRPIRFLSESGSAMFDLVATEGELGPGMWEAETPSAGTLADLFDAGGEPIITTLGDVGGDGMPLALPREPRVAELIRSCAGR